jgi:hypothetical protein
MKRTWIVVLLVILSAMPAVAGVSVKTPVANENLDVGVPALITWFFDGPPTVTEEKFMIVLLHNKIEVGTIIRDLVYKTPSNNIYNKSAAWCSYIWEAGTLMDGKIAKLGTGYSIKIQSMKSTSDSGISGYFTLSAMPIPPPPPPPIEASSKLGGKTFKARPSTISITNPKAGDALYRPTILNVKWNKVGIMDPNVSVTLLSKGAVVATLATSTPNNGTFNWDTSLFDFMDGPYSLRVRTLDRGVEAISAEFTTHTLN